VLGALGLAALACFPFDGGCVAGNDGCSAGAEELGDGAPPDGGTDNGEGAAAGCAGAVSTGAGTFNGGVISFTSRRIVSNGPDRDGTMSFLSTPTVRSSAFMRSFMALVVAVNFACCKINACSGVNFGGCARTSRYDPEPLIASRCMSRDAALFVALRAAVSLCFTRYSSLDAMGDF